MKKIAVILLVILVFITSCARVLNIEPDGFSEVIDGFDSFEISIRDTLFDIYPNRWNFEVVVDGYYFNEKDVEDLLSGISKYLNGEQFRSFMERHESPNSAYMALRVGLIISFTKREDFKSFTAYANSNFTKWRNNLVENEIIEVDILSWIRD